MHILSNKQSKHLWICLKLLDTFYLFIIFIQIWKKGLTDKYIGFACIHTELKYIVKMQLPDIIQGQIIYEVQGMS